MKVKRITPEQYLTLAELGIPVRAYGYSVPRDRSALVAQFIVDSPDSYEWAKRMVAANKGRSVLECYTVVDDDEPAEEG